MCGIFAGVHNDATSYYVLVKEEGWGMRREQGKGEGWGMRRGMGHEERDGA